MKRTNSVALSVLDLSPIPSGSTASQALKNTIDLAKHVEALGFERFWLAEHHNAATLACSAPEIMIAAVAAATSRIRVGSGGIMLPNHSPLKIAEVFRVLSALHPDRIDLGLGRAAGTDPKTALALRQAKELVGTDGFPENVEELMTFLTRDPDPSARFGPIKAIPTNVPSPPIWILGSGEEGARLAGRLGVGYAHAHHINSDMAVAGMRAYCETFHASSRFLDKPHAILAVAVLCAETEEQTEDLLRCVDLQVIRFGQGMRDLPLPSIEEARAYTFDSEEEVFRQGARTRSIAGPIDRITPQLEALIETTQAQELMILTGIHDHEERKRSYDRLAAALL